ncbi:class I SAM-dependent methyltransferase [Streptomyces sulphureus]|uniref:class I SAM-dependent methyltransferase n=1 Tax=Streptomyces sulphureus TaxID=47758 RepID=UPI00036615D5|nr:class I SAM-dependent methyltransferase [Streptomyces sulphureus]
MPDRNKAADACAAGLFAGLGDDYDAARPRPPHEIVDLLFETGAAPAPTVVDLGAGTGLSTLLWAGRASRVVAVEPAADMRAVLSRHVTAGRFAGTPVEVRDATAEATGLPDACADVVTASQSLHWCDTARALPEIARIVRPGGLLAVYNPSWPPQVDPEVDDAFVEFRRRVRQARSRGRTSARPRGPGTHELLAASGLFREVQECELHRKETGDAARLITCALTIGDTGNLLASGTTEADIGLDALREVAARRLSAPRDWRWTYRLHLARR